MEIKQKLLEDKVPCLNIVGKDTDRAIQFAKVQGLMGEYFVYKTPKTKHKRGTQEHLQKLCGDAVVVENEKSMEQLRKI